MSIRLIVYLIYVGFYLNVHHTSAQCLERWPNSGIFITSDNQRCHNVLDYNLPYLSFPVDARSAAQGFVGVALSPDVNSIRHNTAKLTFSDSIAGIGITHSFGTTRFTRDKKQFYLSAYHRLSKKEVVALDFQHFDHGKLQYLKNLILPNEILRFSSNAVTIGYARRINHHLSLGANLKMIFQGAGPEDLFSVLRKKSVFSGALDLSLFYDKGTEKSNFSLGLTLSNLGPKISSVKDQFDFIPSNFGLGTSWLQRFTGNRSLRLSIEINKLLVPSPDRDIFNPSSSPQTDRHKNQSALAGFFRSWSDAPLKEELYEVNYRFGMEFYINHEFAIRTGYYNDHPYKGGRQVATIGAGLRPHNWSLDVSYNIRTRRFNIEPQDDSFHLSLQYYLGRKNKKKANSNLSYEKDKLLEYQLDQFTPSS